MGERIYRIIFNRTPKCHTEIVGEDIEYSWECKNNYYRQFSLDNKTGKKILKRFKGAIPGEKLTTKWVSMYYICVRGYIIEYKLMSHMKLL